MAMKRKRTSITLSTRKNFFQNVEFDITHLPEQAPGLNGKVKIENTSGASDGANESQVINVAFYHQSRAVSARNYRGDTPRL